jgi:zinc protease
LGDVLTIRLIENLREEKSGVYGVGANGYERKYPYGKYIFLIGFPCGPQNVETLMNAALDEVEKIKENGVLAQDIEKVKATQLNHYKENMRKNNYWLSQIRNYCWEGRDFEKIPEKEKIIENLNGKDLKKIADKYLTEKSKIEIILMPETVSEERN